MRISLIIFGVIFLVIGGLLYFVPMQEISADTTTSGGGDVDNRTSSARLSVPVEWAFTSAIIGLTLLILGFVIPGSTRNKSKKDSYDNVIESRENIKIGKGNKRKIVRESTEHHRSR